jgi:hypothetical protein
MAEAVLVSGLTDRKKGAGARRYRLRARGRMPCPFSPSCDPYPVIRQHPGPA